jgi:hypothetical protein
MRIAVELEITVLVTPWCIVSHQAQSGNIRFTSGANLSDITMTCAPNLQTSFYILSIAKKQAFLTSQALQALVFALDFFPQRFLLSLTPDVYRSNRNNYP